MNDTWTNPNVIDDMNDELPPIDAEPTTAVIKRPEAPLAPAESVSGPISPAQAKINAIADLTSKAYERASQLQLTPEERTALTAEFPDTDFQPGAAGKENLIYIQHSALRTRFNTVLGIGQWAIIPRSRWEETYRTAKGNEAHRVYVEAMLLIRGCFVGESVGDMSYYPNNDGQNYGDAVEGAKTAAFRRCAKELGVGLQAWDKVWCEGWWQRRRGQPAPRIEHPRNQAPPAPAKPAVPFDLGAFREACKTKLLLFLVPHEVDGLEYFQKMGWILDTEALGDAQARQLFPSVTDGMTKEQAFRAAKADFDRLVSAITGIAPDPDQAPTPPAEPAPAPAKEPDPLPADALTISGEIEAVSKKEGSSAKGPWTRYGVKIGDLWLNTFSATLGDVAQKLKGKHATAWYKQGAKGADLLELKSA